MYTVVSRNRTYRAIFIEKCVADLDLQQATAAYRVPVFTGRSWFNTRYGKKLLLLLVLLVLSVLVLLLFMVFIVLVLVVLVLLLSLLLMVLVVGVVDCY